MHYFIVAVGFVTASSAPDSAEIDSDAYYEVLAGTSGKAINLVLAHTDSVAEERHIGLIGVEGPYSASISDEGWSKRCEDSTLIRLPTSDVMPQHVVRG